MKIPAAWLLLLFFHLYTVTSTYFPPPVFKSTPPPTNMSTSQTLVFFEEANVTLTCSLPMDPIPDDIEVQIVTGKYEHNPVYPDEYLNFTIHQDKLQLDIQYNHQRFIPFFNVSCLAINRTSGETKNSSDIVIEQQYKTMNVIHSGMMLRQIDAGETVRLECLADGNPKPEYQWYNRTEDGNQTMMENGTQRILEFVTPTNWSTESLYVCGAKNKYNTQTMEADTIIVMSALIPPPQILPIPSPTNDSTTSKFVFFEEQKVNVTCSLPMTIPVPDYMQQRMNYSQVQLNPVYPQEIANINKDDKFSEVTLQIEYKPNVFVSLIEVTCQSLHLRKHTIKTVTIQIEQQYKTMNVIIMVNTTVEPGEKVNLTCAADGNPEPKLYQWYNKTGSGNEELKGATQTTLQLTIPEKWSSSGEYICGAKNSYNQDFKLSQTVKISATVPTTEPPGGNSAAYKSISWVLLVASFLVGLLARNAGS